MSDIAKLGFSVDTRDLKKGEKALDDFAKTGKKTEASIDTSSKRIKEDFESLEKTITRTSAKQDRAMAQFSRRSGQAGIQLQQFIGQVQGGQSVMLALSQQSADLGFVLGAPLLGAIAGISASLVGLLIPNLIDTTSAMEDLDKAMGEVNKTATDTDGVKAFTKEIADLAGESEKAARLLILAAEQSARDAGKAAAEGIGEEFNDAFDVTIFQRSFDALKAIAGTALGTGFSISKEYEELGEQFGLTGKQAREAGIEILVSLREMEDAVSLGLPNADEKIIAFQEQLSELAESASGENRVKLLKFVNAISEYTNKARLAAEMQEFFNKTLEEQPEKLPTEKTNDFAKSVERVSDSLHSQILAMREGEEASLSFNIAQRLGLETTEQIPEAIKVQIRELMNLKKAKKEAADKESEAKKQEAARQKELRDFKKLVDDVENFGGAWSKTGSVIIDVFGDISDSIIDYMDQLDSLNSLQERINQDRLKEGADIVALNMLQQKVDQDRVFAELDGIKKVTAATGSMFSEKTAAAKAFAALNKVLTIAELALSAQKIVAGNTETAAHVTNETTKSSANALTAITSAFAAPFPINFVAGAAMIGIMASLVGKAFSGGGSSRPSFEEIQANQGTGTVLGSDDKSKSILESQDRFEDISLDQLAELRGIRNAMTGLSDGIARLASSIVVGADFEGGRIQGLGTTKQFETNVFERLGELSFRGAGIEGNILAEIGDPLGAVIDRVIGNFNKTTTKLLDTGIRFNAQEIGDLIATGVMDATYFDVIEKTKRKFFGAIKRVSTEEQLTGIEEPILEEFARIFGFIGDAINNSIETLGIETANSLEDFIIDLGDVSFKDLTGEEIQKELEAIFSQQADLITQFLVPSLENYQQIGEGLFDTLTRVTKEQVIFNDSLEMIGISLSDLSATIQIDIAQSMIQLTGGIENLSDLTTSFFENFFTEAEQFAFLGQSLADVFESIGLPMVKSREGFRDLVDSIDVTTNEGRELLAVILEINPALSEYIKELERVESRRTEMTIELLRLQGNAEEALAMEREIELAAMDESLRALQLLIFAEEDRIAALNKQEDAARDAFSMLEKSVDLERQRIQAIFDAAREAHEAEIERIDDLRSALDAENELRKSNLADAEEILKDSFNREISLIQENANNRIASLNEERLAIAGTASAMRSLVGNINKTLGLDGSTDLISALTSARRGDFTQARNLNVSALATLDEGDFLSATDFRIQQAVNQNRLAEIGKLAGEELTQAEMMIQAIDDQIVTIKEVAESESMKLTEQLDSLLNIDSNVIGVSDAIENFKIAQLELEKLNFEEESARLDMLIESADDVFDLHRDSYNTEFAKLDSIITLNLSLLNTSLNINNSILTIPNAIAALQQTVSDIPKATAAATAEANKVKENTQQQVMIDEIKRLREDNAMFQREIVKNTNTTASASKDSKLNGLDVRIIS